MISTYPPIDNKKVHYKLIKEYYPDTMTFRIVRRIIKDKTCIWGMVTNKTV